MSWVIKSASEIRFSFQPNMNLWISLRDIENNGEVNRIKSMPEVSNEEKLRLLQEKEREIIMKVAEEKFKAISNYAQQSQSSELEVVDAIGDPEGRIDWDEVLGLSNNIEDTEIQ